MWVVFLQSYESMGYTSIIIELMLEHARIKNYTETIKHFRAVDGSSTYDVLNQSAKVDDNRRNISSTLLWRFVQATFSQTRRLQRERIERTKRHEPIYNVKY